MQKNSFIKTSLIGLILLALPSISFGQSETCISCTTSPTQLSMINNFTIEMLSAIRTVGTEPPYAGKPVPPSWFDSGKFSPPANGIMSKTLKRARESVNSTLSLTRIYTPLRIRQNMLGLGTQSLTLFKNSTFQRDRKKTNIIEEFINKKKYELAVGGGRRNTVKGAALKRMQNIIKNYQEKGLLKKESKIGNDVEYNQILIALGSINTALKYMIATNSNSRLSQTFTQDNLSLQINPSAIEAITKDYSCAKEQKCNSSRQTLKKDLKDMRSGVKSGSKGARSQIKAANQKLKTARGKKPTKTAKTKFLNFQYGGLDKEQIQEVGATLKNTILLPAKARRSLRQKKATEQQPNTTPTSTETKNTGGKTETKDMSNQITTSSTQENQNDKLVELENLLTQNMNNIKAEANTMNESALFATVNDVTIYFTDLSDKLTFLTKKIIGSKDQPNTLINNFGELCSKQCSNISNKKCYY